MQQCGWINNSKVKSYFHSDKTIWNMLPIRGQSHCRDWGRQITAGELPLAMSYWFTYGILTMTVNYTFFMIRRSSRDSVTGPLHNHVFFHLIGQKYFTKLSLINYKLTHNYCRVFTTLVNLQYLQIWYTHCLKKGTTFWIV